MNKKIKIAIVDDHQLFREGLKFILSQFDDFEVIYEVSNGKEFLDILQHNNKPDIVLMDIAMPVLDGIATTKKAMDKYPDLKIIALTMFGEENYYYKMVEAGVKGFLLKETGSTELTDAIKEIYEGGNFFSDKLLRKILVTIGTYNYVETPKGKVIKLSKREIEVLKKICNGMSNSEIADNLNISRRTVEGHRANLLKRTGAKNTANLIMFAIKYKLIEV